MTDWGALYREHVGAVCALATDLTADELAREVPATPAWTVHDLIDHLAGGPSDAVTGRMDGAPGPEWTARHVGERRGLPVPDLVTEMQSHQDPIAEQVADNPRPAIVWDIAVHHAELVAFGFTRRFGAPGARMMVSSSTSNSPSISSSMSSSR